MILACACGTNVGQIATQAAQTLERQGLASLPPASRGRTGRRAFAEAAQRSFCVALDGCDVACARRTLEKAGVAADLAVVVTDLGVDKAHVPATAGQVARVAGTVATALAQAGATPTQT
jgi:uncharacterized metal-binding protein